MRRSDQAEFVLQEKGTAAVFVSASVRLRLGFTSRGTVRVSYTSREAFLERPSHIVVATEFVGFELQEDNSRYTLSTGAMTVDVMKATGALSYYDGTGALLVREPARGGKWISEKDICRNVFRPDTSIAYGQSIDGARAKVTDYETVFDRKAFEAKVEFVFGEDEALFGFGSHEEGYGNLRGRSRDLYQQNMKAVVPYFVSTRGYGVLFDCCSLMTFHDDAYGSYWWADVVDELDYYVICGETFDEVTRGYHLLTGGVPMLPAWAFGYVQSKERYVNAAELIDVVREYRRREVPLDAIVLDWKSWPNGAGWGQKTFDSKRFPNPAAMTEELHGMGARLMVSIWPIMTGGCENQRELLDEGLMLGNQSTYDAFDPEGRRAYWNQAERGLFAHGVDAWWCDCTEPFEADWSGAVKPEPHARLAIDTGESKLYLDAGEINAYSLLHSRGIYEGQRGVTTAKRVMNLTRSSYAGQHRYGTITWNGDICGTWETLRRCIPEGVNFCASGEPFWTVDVGGFFVDDDRELWFWRGEYSEGCRGLTDGAALEPDPNDTGCKDMGYWELYTRWLQYAVFLPMFRSHGTDAAREIWRFGDVGGQFYDVIARYIRLRYELMPYIYSLAARVTFASEPIVRAVALQFPRDCATHDLLDQFFFGAGLMVCPVTEPMYFGVGSRPLVNVAKSRSVYLPEGADWYDFWTCELHRGGQRVVADAPLGVLPLFVRAGTIIPMTCAMQFVNEVRDAAYELRVYSGADAEFVLYEDEGDGYGYEQGAFAVVKLRWVEAEGRLTVAAREGEFEGLVCERDFRIRFFGREASGETTVRYTGDELHVSRELI